MWCTKSAIFVAALAMLSTGIVAKSNDVAAEPCFSVGRTTFCDARGAANTVGSSLIFNQGQPGRRVGRFIIVEEDGFPRTRSVVGLDSTDGRFRETRPAGTVPTLPDNSNFGTYAVSRSSRFAPLQRSGPNN